MTEENKEKLLQMTILANRLRGIYIGAFTNLEHILADIVINVSYEGNASNYYKTFKTAKNIHNDFWASFDKIKNKLKGSINDESILKSDLEKLIEHRNILAHWVLMTDDIYVENFNGESIWLYSWRFQKDHLEKYCPQQIHVLENEIAVTLQTLSLIQQDVYSFLKKPYLQ